MRWWTVALIVGHACSMPDWAHRQSDDSKLCASLEMVETARDKAVAHNLYRERMRRGGKKAHFFVVGAHNGADIETVVTAPWWNASNGVVHGWEILDSNIAAAHARLRDNVRRGDVVLDHRGVSSQRGMMKRRSVGHSGEGGFLDVSNGEAKLKSRMNEFEAIEIVAWADVARERSIGEVAYSLVDTEGHEPLVLAGMNLRRNAKTSAPAPKTTPPLRFVLKSDLCPPHRFPAFQLEFGTTWCDGRRASDRTQHDVATVLTSLGYALFLMGHASCVEDRSRRRRGRSASRGRGLDDPTQATRNQTSTLVLSTMRHQQSSSLSPTRHS